MCIRDRIARDQDYRKSGFVELCVGGAGGLGGAAADLEEGFEAGGDEGAAQRGLVVRDAGVGVAGAARTGSEGAALGMGADGVALGRGVSVAAVAETLGSGEVDVEACLAAARPTTARETPTTSSVPRLPTATRPQRVELRGPSPVVAGASDLSDGMGGGATSGI